MKVERNLAKRFEDERLKRLINCIDEIEDLRKLCLKIYEAKVVQEQVLMQMLFSRNIPSIEQVEGLLPRPIWNGETDQSD